MHMFEAGQCIAIFQQFDQPQKGEEDRAIGFEVGAFALFAIVNRRRPEIEDRLIVDLIRIEPIAEHTFQKGDHPAQFAVGLDCRQVVAEEFIDGTGNGICLGRHVGGAQIRFRGIAQNFRERRIADGRDKEFQEGRKDRHPAIADREAAIVVGYPNAGFLQGNRSAGIRRMGEMRPKGRGGGPVHTPEHAFISGASSRQRSGAHHMNELKRHLFIVSAGHGLGQDVQCLAGELRTRHSFDLFQRLKHVAQDRALSGFDNTVGGTAHGLTSFLTFLDGPAAEDAGRVAIRHRDIHQKAHNIRSLDVPAPRPISSV